MWPLRSSHKTASLVALILTFGFVGNTSAVEPPKTGNQWLTFGFALSPGFLHDKNAPERGVTSDSANIGVAYRFGLQHALASTFYMAAEAEVGSTYFRPHTADPSGVTGSENAFSWQLGLIGRYLPLGDEGGLTLGGGLHLFRADLEAAGLQSLSIDARVGWLIWQRFDFVSVEFGYAFPALSGLNTPTFEFEGQDELVEQTWNFHRFGLALTYGF